MDDGEPDFAALLGWDAQPSAAALGDEAAAGQVVACASGDCSHAGFVVVAHSGGDGFLGPGGGVLVPVPADEDPQTPPCAPRRKHRKTHGAFSGTLPNRSIEVRRAFSDSGNMARWSAYREKQLQAENI